MPTSDITVKRTLMKKILILFFAVVTAICASITIAFALDSNIVYAQTETPVTPTLSKTKYLKSTDGAYMLIATGISNHEDCYEVGYEVNNLISVACDTQKYYTHISVNGGKKVWLASDLFPGFDKMIVWEVKTDETITSFKAYARVGERIDGVLYESDTIVYGTEKSVIFKRSALVVGDVHIGKEKVCKTNLIETLQYVKDSEDIKVVIFNGDTVDFATEENYALLDECFEGVFGDVPQADRPEFLFNMGNHEFYPTVDCDLHDTDYEREFGLFREFANKWMSEPIGEGDNVYMRTIDGISYVVAFPSSRRISGTEYASIGQFLDSDFDKLEVLLDKATKNGNPCVVATHWPWGYTYGGSSYGMPNDYIIEDMTELLAKYPQVINVTSHTHFSDLHERSFDQTYYTTVNVGTHCLGKHFGGSIIENGVETGGFEDENGELATYMNLSRRGINSKADLTAHSIYWSGTVHFGIGLDFNSESATIKRINIGKGEDYAHGEWIVPYGITTENYHDKFSYEAGERSGETLEFAEDAELSVEITSTGSTESTIALSFTDVENYWAVEGYKIEIYNKKNELIYKTWWQSLFWADRGEKSAYSITINDVSASDSYTVKVYPMDFFGHYNEPLVMGPDDCTVTVEGGAGSGEYKKGESVTAWAFVPSGEKFARWTVGGEEVSTDNPYTFTVTGDVTITAVFIDAHLNAKQYSAKFNWFNLSEPLDNFAYSDKWLVFEYKPVDNYANTGNSFQFTLWDTGWNWPRSTELITVDVVNNTVSGAKAIVTELEDGWYRVSIKASDLPINTAEGADGSETLGSFIFNELDHALLMDNVGFCEVDIDEYTVTVEGGTGGGVYIEGAEVTVVATIPSGKRFVEWQKGGVKVSDKATYTFNVTENITLTAVFEDTKVMLSSGYQINLPDYDASSATTLEFDVYTTSARSPYSKINIVLTDENGVSTKYYRVTYNGVNTAYNGEGVSAAKIATDTWHVVFTLSDLTNGKGTSLGKLATMSDSGSTNITGCWIDNIEFK